MYFVLQIIVIISTFPILSINSNLHLDNYPRECADNYDI